MKEIFGKRLLNCRKQAGLSQDDLVSRIGGVVKKTAIAKYERGEMMPKLPVINLLASVLNQPVEYFFRPYSLSITRGDFRSKTTLGARNSEQIREDIYQHIERYLTLEQLTGDIPRFENPFKDVLISNNNQLDKYAVELREIWELGSHPLGSVMAILESKGIRVIDIQVTGNDFEGFSAIANDALPVIAVRTEATTERRRFTALHELAHLLFEFDPALTQKETERLCHYFASAMLIPDNVFYSEFGRFRTNFSIKELSLIKDKYGISAYAFIMRAYNLRVISPVVLARLRKIVLLDPLEMHIGTNKNSDMATRFDQILLRALNEQNISITKAAELAGMPLDKFIKLYTDHD